MQLDYDVFEIWKYGYPVLSNQEICLKSACYLCGSFGLEQNKVGLEHDFKDF